MGLTMTVEEREEFLAGVHVGVLAVERSDGPPLAVPVWYDYRPGGDLWILTPEDSVKGQLLTAARRFSLCAQDEDLPPKYVTVEGPVVAIEPASVEEHVKAMAVRRFSVASGVSGRAEVSSNASFSTLPRACRSISNAR